MKFRRTQAILAGLASITGVVLATSPQAGAAAPSTCPSGQLCFYQDGAFQKGVFVTNVPSIGDFQDYKFSNGRSLNDGISSIYNNTGHKVYMFVNSWFVASTGDCGFGASDVCYADEVVPAHTGHSKITFNDKYSSFMMGN